MGLLRLRRSAAVVAALGVAGAGFISAYAGNASAASKSVMGTKTKPALEDCGMKPAQVRPKMLVLACGDGGSVGQDLTWTKWAGTEAYATGVYTWNPCIPYCAATKPKAWRKVPANFTLEDPVKTSAGWLFETLVIHLTGKVPAKMPKVLTFPEKPIPER